MFNKIKSLIRFLIGRYRLIKLNRLSFNLHVGKGFYCGKNCFFSRKNNIRIGDNFYMGNYCHLSANASIGNDVLFASFVSLVGGDHKIDNIKSTIRESGRDILKTIVIENNVWIGHGSIIMHGVTIQNGAVVAAGSVVTKDIPSNEIWGGNPAKFIRKRILL